MTYGHMWYLIFVSKSAMEEEDVFRLPTLWITVICINFTLSLEQVRNIILIE